MWKPFPGSKTQRLIGNIYKLRYRGIQSYVYKLGKKAIPLNVNDLTSGELRIIAKDKECTQ
jgi:hypothetical protein